MVTRPNDIGPSRYLVCTITNRKDSIDGIRALIQHDFNVYTQDTIQGRQEYLNPAFTKEVHLLALDGMPKMSEGRGSFLKDHAFRALEKLSKNDKGYFLLIEESQIDWGGHANDHDWIVSEMKDLNRTLHALLDYQEDYPETLIIVTADHETGGYALSAKRNGVRHDTRYLEPSFNTGYHSATMVPVFAIGPGSHEFRGIYENTEIHAKMKKLLFQK